MANEIHNYPLEIFTIGDNDYLDVDFFNGVGYDSSKILGSNLNAGKYSALIDGPSVTGLIEQSIVPTLGSGSLTVPANYFNQGDTYRCIVKGMLGAHNNDQITVRIKAGLSTLANSGPITMPTITNKVFSIVMDFTIRQVGSAGVAEVITAGEFTYNKDSANIYEGQDFIGVENTTFDTTIFNTLDVTVQYSSSNANNTMQAMLMVLTKIK